ncbi:hypothetical protein F511_14650 [Dorcoceras hygrometricum]|uniref:Retrotransposon gag domain-containing protein n=1 Tax=Dorcoceras hygrometricum TaxID=472368 RepID=A0A2Z7AUL2_9LAMI|nr:hypothetical protein F511_14650 [Dorcoceras hygrometricum]
MELVFARFQRMNPQTFLGAEVGVVAEGWLGHMEVLFDRVKYDEECRLSLATFQLREHARQWWKVLGIRIRPPAGTNSGEVAATAAAHGGGGGGGVRGEERGRLF